MTQALPKTLLITGASGFLGWHLCQAAHRQGWTVHGLYHHHPFETPGTTMHRVNMTDLAELRGAIASIQPDAVIHAAAQARPNVCETDPTAAYAINVMASLYLADLCNAGLPTGPHRHIPIPCIFVSTNQVFDGTQAPYREADAVSPINVYGEQKVAAEEGMLSRHSRLLVCRMPLLFGQAPTAPSFLQGFLDRIRRGEPLKLFVDEFRTPVSGTDAAKGLLVALGALTQDNIPLQNQGRLHLGGPERLSRLDFGKILIETMALDPCCITGCRQADVKMAAARAEDLSMDSSCAQQLGYRPEAIRTALERLQLSL